MIVVDMTRVPDEERAARIQAEIQLVRQQCAAAVAAYHWQQKLQAERERRKREERDRRRLYWLQRTTWTGWGFAIGFVLALLASGGGQ